MLFDVYNTLIRESKDVSQYYTEAVRAVYGLNIEDIRLADYEGMTTQETIGHILTKAGLGQQEIGASMEKFMEQLPYDHYNVAGHDNAILMDGAQDVLKAFSTDSNWTSGIATGLLERIVRNMFDRAALKLDSLIKFGYYGNAGRDYSSIIDPAISQAMASGAEREEILMASSSRYAISAAKSKSIWAVGVTTGKFSADELKAAGADTAVKNLKDVLKAARSHRF